MIVVQDVVAWKGGLYFRDEPGGEESKPLKGSLVAFTKNGRLQGVAYRHVAVISSVDVPANPALTPAGMTAES